MIAFLHTNKAHKETFETLVRQHNATIEIKHYVNKDILDNALLNGKTDTHQFNKDIEEIRKDKPSLIICTCSTYGAESDKHNDVFRIDKPVIEFLVTNYTKIGLVYTANSTKTVSEDLMLHIAAKKDTPIEVVSCDCSEYWSFFEAGDFKNYEKGIAKNIKEMAHLVDVFFLAQASMAGTTKHLSMLDKEVFTSPEFGIKALLKNI
ncbi:hypothetical protein CLV33_105123 [Jejuia pallidilutea]|uniref:Glutamate racemase n=1 Tax=Jejuia pallidilutea TaxID=504487 RepID=A0A362X313_9FLAO|nr:hypothetical protein [Jejuia pallidilutea]PQV48273.1 hypothetical protein CLV33_105123 [Jejuia pallidilutea]